MNKHTSLAVLVSFFFVACGGSVVEPGNGAHEEPEAAAPETAAPEAGAPEAAAPEASPAAPEAAPDGPTYRGCDPSSCDPDSGVPCCGVADAAPDVPATCASCCRVQVGMTTCPADWGCGACCDTLDDGGANPLCP